MASENEPSAWTHPFSTSDISVYDYQTLLNALKAYCKNTSAKLIFDLDPEEPGLGETRNLDHEKPGPGKKRNLDQTNILNSGKDFYDGLTADDANAITEADHQQWETVKKNIDTFVENPHGSVLKKSLVEDLTDQLKNGQLKNYHGDAPIPEDLYELFIAHQLAWRQDYRAKNNGGRRHSIGHHPDRRGPTFSVTLVMEVANSSAVKTKTIHLSVNITEPSSYFDFLKELRVASQSPQAEEEGFESGYGYEHGPWMFENHDVGEEETLEEFKNFDIDTWERVRGKDIPYLFWHCYQYMILRQRDIDFIEENSSQDPAGHILVAPLITHPASRNFWRDIGSVGHSITAPLLTKQDSKKYWQEMRESVANFSWDFFTKPNILLTEDEQNAIVIECQSPKKDRVDSVQNNTLPNERGNIPLNEWVWQPSVSPPTEKMNRHDQETRRWEAHINLLLEAGTQAIKHGRVNDMPNPESLLEEMMQYGREQLEEECKQQ